MLSLQSRASGADVEASGVAVGASGADEQPYPMGWFRGWGCCGVVIQLISNIWRKPFGFVVRSGYVFRTWDLESRILLNL